MRSAIVPTGLLLMLVLPGSGIASIPEFDQYPQPISFAFKIVDDGGRPVSPDGFSCEVVFDPPVGGAGIDRQAVRLLGARKGPPRD